MTSPARLPLLSLCLLLAVGACRGTESSTAMASYADEASLPACNASQHLKVVYTAAEDGLWLCRDGKGWARLLAEGPAGQAGQQGPRGEQGPQGTTGDAGTAGASTLSRVTAEAAGTHCPAGGEKVELGLDVDGNGALSDSEVTQVLYVCDGCVPETDDAFCDRMASCGATTGVDACNTPRTAECACGVLEDPHFLNAPVAWTVEGAATVEPGASVTLTGQPPLTTVGAARFSGDALVSDHFGRVHQDVRMPAVTPGGPNAVSLAAGTIHPGVTFASGLPGTVFLGVDDRYQSAGSLVYGNLRTSLCLGEAGLAAGKRRFTVTAHGSGLLGSPQDVFVDLAALVHDENCPAPGTLMNGDFEKQATMEWPTAGWTLESGDASEANLFAPSPLAGARSGMLRRLDGCTAPPSMSAPVNLPLAGGKRLQAKVQGQGTGRMVLALDGLVVDARDVATLGAPGTVMSACVPAAFAGTVREVVLRMDKYGNVLCGPELTEVTVDDVELVDDPTCPAGGVIPNGDVEAGAAGWYPVPTYTGSTQFFSTPSDPTRAHGGSRFVELSVDDPCLGRALTQPFVVPPRASSGGGMAVKFAYQLEDGLQLMADALASTFSQPGPTTGWANAVLCLPKGTDGFDAQLRLSILPPGGICGPITPLAARLDDLRVEPDATCP